MILAVALSAIWGGYLGVYGEFFVSPFGVGSLVFGLLLMAFGFYFQLIFHELGHLVCGLLSGYRFSSFRIGSLVLLKSSEGWSLKRLRLLGTGGQCLLNPPEGKEEEAPFLLYNLGGALFNFFSSVFFLFLYSLLPAENWWSVLCLNIAVFGVPLALINGIPLRNALVSNDGENARLLKKDPLARRALQLQLKVNEQQVEGVRLRDMPEEWFLFPEDADMGNPLISAVAVFAENRLMDELNFSEAKERIQYLKKQRIIGLYAYFLEMDRLYIEITEKGTEADLSLWYDKAMKKFAKSMKDFPSVLRTAYAVAKAEGNKAKQKELLARFERVAKTYPSKADILSERELIDHIKERF